MEESVQVGCCLEVTQKRKQDYSVKYFYILNIIQSTTHDVNIIPPMLTVPHHLLLIIFFHFLFLFFFFTLKLLTHQLQPISKSIPQEGTGVSPPALCCAAAFAALLTTQLPEVSWSLGGLGISLSCVFHYLILVSVEGK